MQYAIYLSPKYWALKLKESLEKNRPLDGSLSLTKHYMEGEGRNYIHVKGPMKPNKMFGIHIKELLLHPQGDIKRN